MRSVRRFSGRTGGAVLAAVVAAAVSAGLWAQATTVPRDPVDGAAFLEPLASRSLLLDVARAGERLVAVGERGHVLLSDDGGKSWRQAKAVPTRAMLTAVAFANERSGWAVGHDEVIINTADGGETWTRSNYAPESQQPLLDVWFGDAQRGIAVGAYGSYFTTQDGGQSWVSKKFASTPLIKPPVVKRAAGEAAAFEDVPPDYHLNRILPVGSRLFIAAEAGQLYRSDDAGATWHSLPTPYNGSFFGLLATGPDALLAFGLRGNAFRSADAGLTWSKLDVGTGAMLTDGARLPDGRLALVGLSGTVLTSDASGSRWTLREQADRKGLSGVLALSDGELVAVGEDGGRLVATR